MSYTETEMEYEYPEAKPIDTSIFTEFDDAPGKYCSDNWGDEWLEITNSDIWGLSVRFPHITEASNKIAFQTSQMKIAYM